jgi:hypothetical protein
MIDMEGIVWSFLHGKGMIGGLRPCIDILGLSAHEVWQLTSVAVG